MIRGRLLTSFDQMPLVSKADAFMENGEDAVPFFTLVSPWELSSCSLLCIMYEAGTVKLKLACDIQARPWGNQ